MESSKNLYCSNCGSVLTSAQKFCIECGIEVEANKPPYKTEQLEGSTINTEKLEKKSSGKKKIIIGIISFLILAISICSILVTMNINKQKQHALSITKEFSDGLSKIQGLKVTGSQVNSFNTSGSVYTINMTIDIKIDPGIGLTENGFITADYKFDAEKNKILSFNIIDKSSNFKDNNIINLAIDSIAGMVAN